MTKSGPSYFSLIVVAMACMSIDALTIIPSTSTRSPSFRSAPSHIRSNTALSYSNEKKEDENDSKHSSSSNNNDINNKKEQQLNNKETNGSAIWLPSQHPDSANRMARLVKEQEGIERFPQTMEELQGLRSDINTLKNNLKWAKYTDDINRIIALKLAIEEKEESDPDLVYAKALKKIVHAKRNMKVGKKYEAIKRYTEEAEMARQFIPRLNLEGLWVGNYGEHGSELVNITYSGDTLIATKVTGDKHVPRSEVSFRADLGPKFEDDEEFKKETKPLAPIQLTGSMASKWGTGKLERYPGEGQVSAKGYKNKQFVEGQLIMFDKYFSFLWVPTKHHVFFSRPNPKLTLHLMRDIISEEDETANMKDHLQRCYEKDISYAFIRPNMNKESFPEPFRRIHREVDLVSAMEEKDGVIVDSKKKNSDENGVGIHLPTLSFPFPIASSSSPTSTSANDQSTAQNFKFWAVQKWRNYIDSVMKDTDGSTGFNNFP